MQKFIKYEKVFIGYSSMAHCADHMEGVQSFQQWDTIQKAGIKYLAQIFELKPTLSCLAPKGRHQLKKNVFFWALPELPNPPPMTPIRATWSSFFGSQKWRFESQFRTKNTIYTI